MSEYISPSEFLRLRDEGLPLIDVRSPSEYAHAHIPGSLNLPLLSDEEREAEERAEAEERERRERRRRSSTFWQLFSGTILVREGVSKYYPYMLTIAGMFFLSIMVMFWSLHLDMRYTRLERDVQKLRERSIRLQEQRYQRTTHSAIVEQLRARGIELYDPQAPGEIIEN